jgi:hypothetical protein
MSWGTLRTYEVYENPGSSALDDYLVAIGELERVEGPRLVGAA